MITTNLPTFRHYQPDVVEPFEDLSSIPSMLIRQVTGDLWVTLRHPEVEFYGGNWLSVRGPSDSFPDRKPVCRICVAGGTMLRRLPADMLDKSECWPGTFGEDGAELLEALNYLREGRLHAFMGSIPGWESPRGIQADMKLCPPLFELSESSVSKEVVFRWCEDANKVADWLESHGC